MAIMFVLAALAVSSGLALRKPRAALFAAVFFIPWAGLDVDAGLRVTAYLVLITPLFVVSTLRGVLRRSKARKIGLGAFWLVIAYAVVWSLVQVPFLPESAVAGGALRQPAVRSVMQIIMFLITISPVWIVPSLVRDRSDMTQVGKVYVLSVAILAGVGCLQLAIWVATGTDPFPVGFFNELLGGQGTQRSGMFEYMGGQIYRMSSFGGEPKGLGVGLGVALLLVQAGVRPKGKHATWLWPFLFVSMMATFSTMAILCWFGATAFQLFVTPQGSIRFPQMVGRSRGILRWAGWSIPIIFVVILSGKGGPVLEMIEMRTTGRVAQSERGALEDFNIAVMDFLVEHPYWAITGTGLGNAHLYADLYLPDFAVPYASGTPFAAKSAALRWISEIGAVSLAVFLFWVLRNASRTVNLAHRLVDVSEIAAVAIRFFLPLMVFWIVSGYITMQFYVTIGFFVALKQLARTAQVRSGNGAYRNILSPTTSIAGDRYVLPVGRRGVTH